MTDIARIAELGEDGKLLPEQVPDGIGAVESVNGNTGEVVLDAADVGAAADDDPRLADARTPTSHGNEAHDEEYLTVGAASGSYVSVVDAGTDLNTARPAGAAAVLWQFDAGVDVGEEGANVTNGESGDLYVVKSA